MVQSSPKDAVLEANRMICKHSNGIQNTGMEQKAYSPVSSPEHMQIQVVVSPSNPRPLIRSARSPLRRANLGSPANRIGRSLIDQFRQEQALHRLPSSRVPILDPNIEKSSPSYPSPVKLSPVNPQPFTHEHVHYSHRAPWLRALVLGANDGLVTVSSLMLGVGASGKYDPKSILVSGIAGLIAGASSMGIGEYVSVYSQRDSELADLEAERREHEEGGPEAVARELEELTQIYVSRGLHYDLARRVAEELSAGDVVKVHAREELGIDVDELARPMQAAIASAIAFSTGGSVPLLGSAFVMQYVPRLVALIVSTTLGLGVFGMIGARLGGSGAIKGCLRVVIGGWMAMGITYGSLKLVSLISI